MKIQKKIRVSKKNVLIAILLLLPLSTFGRETVISEKERPFHPGEKLKYQICWNSIPAGEAALEVAEIQRTDDQASYHFILKVRSNRFIDRFYRYRSTIESVTDYDMNRSLLYRKKEKKRGKKRKILVEFDWDTTQAHYFKSGKKKKTIPLQPGSLDPLSVVYYIRSADIENLRHIETPVSDGKKNFTGSAEIVRKEKLELNGKMYDTYLIEPDLKYAGGVFKKSKFAKLQLWVTADAHRIPLKLKSSLSIGSVTAELVTVPASVRGSVP